MLWIPGQARNDKVVKSTAYNLDQAQKGNVIILIIYYID